MSVSTEFAGVRPEVPVRRWVLWRCDSCRRFIPSGMLYLLSNYATWHVRHQVLCIPRDHEASTVLRIPVKRIQWTDQFDWWMTYLEHEDCLPPEAIAALLRFFERWVSFPPGWAPQRANLSAPMPVGVA